MEEVPIVPWYLDTDLKPRVALNLSESLTTADLTQPWRIYWPPKTKDVLSMWAQSEYPEVISWRFDSTKPFDRPWRIWTKSLQAMKEQCAISPSKMDLKDAEVEIVSPKLSPVSWMQSANIKYDSCTSQGKRILRWLSFSEYGSKLGLIDCLNLPSVEPKTFHYLAPKNDDSSKLYMSRLPYLPELKRTNITSQSYPVRIQDVSGHEEAFKLDESGFQFVRAPIRVQRWSDAAVCADYLPRMADWLKMHLNCDRVFIYAYNFRGPSLDSNRKNSSKTPFFRVHCGMTPLASAIVVQSSNLNSVSITSFEIDPLKLRISLPDATAASCLKRLQLYHPSIDPSQTRIRLLNIWRPLSTPIQSSPLAFCDYRTTQPRDFVPADIIFPHYHDEAYEVLHNPAHRWFYKKGMQWDDVLLFKLGDSMPSVAPLCPHSAFLDPSLPPGCPERMSIEVRAIAVG